MFSKAVFLKYALLPTAPPGHWAWPGRVALAALRGATGSTQDWFIGFRRKER